MTDSLKPTSNYLTARASSDITCTRVTVSGEVDLLSARDLTAALAAAVEAGPAHLLVDLSQVTFFGSAGLQALISAANHAHLRVVSLALVCSPSVERVLSITGTAGLFRMVPPSSHLPAGLADQAVQVG